jgi:peptide methionine sulfoxide reductase MsrB
MVYSEKDANTICYIQPTEELKAKLSPEEYAVLVEAATEPPFENTFWNNHRDGIYIDKIDRHTALRFDDKIRFRHSWPSFWKPSTKIALILCRRLFSRHAHASRSGAQKIGRAPWPCFDDGPIPTGPALLHQLGQSPLRTKKTWNFEGYGALLRVQIADLLSRGPT